MTTNINKLNKVFGAKRILIPIIIGLSVAFYLVYREFDPNAFSKVNFGFQFFAFLLLAIILMMIRDFAYMVRLRILTEKKIKWRQTFDVIMLWEFASALTPSVVGGSAVAMFIIHKEKISLGRSTAIVMITAIMDELFYVVMVPIIFAIAGIKALFINSNFNLFGNSFSTFEVFLIGYFFIVLLILLLMYGVFISPNRFKKILFSFFKIKFFKRWQRRGINVSNDIIITSRELKDKKMKFWLKAFGATIFSWTARFLVVNALIAAFVSLTLGDHSLIFGRQLIMWVILLISPTPGGSGIAEFFFPIFLGDFIPLGIAASLALLWRLLSYYPYLFIGSIVFPMWLKRVLKSKKQHKID